MAKFIELEKAQYILHSHMSNSDKAKALSKEAILDMHDIRNPSTWVAGVILGCFAIWCMYYFGAVCNI